MSRYSNKAEEVLDYLYEKNALGRAAFYLVAAPFAAVRFIVELPSVLRESFGCGKWYSRHNYQWDAGAKGWWMYCTKCERPVWQDNN